MLDTVGKIVDRMSELKGLSSQDPMKSDQDRASYNNEFKDLQAQLYDISKMKFNGVSLFAEHTTETGGTQAVFGGKDQDAALDNTHTIYTSAEGAAGSKVSIHKSVLLSALTFQTDLDTNGLGVRQMSTLMRTIQMEVLLKRKKVILRLLLPHNLQWISLDLQDISVGVISQALENIAFYGLKTEVFIPVWHSMRSL